MSQITSAENGGAYTQMSLAEVQSDHEIQDLLNFGVQYLTQEEILVQKLPDAQYTVSQIHSVWSQAVSGTNYRFDVDIINNLGWVLRATFEVYSQPWTNTKEVTSYVYDVTTNPNSSVNEEEFVLPNNGGDLDGAYEAVDPSEINTNEDLQNFLDAGTQEVVNQAIIDHLLPESVYQIAQIHSIYSQAVSGTNYQFDVDLINCAGLVARTVFTVYFQSWTHTLDTTPGTLHITSIPNEGLVGGDCPSENNGSEEENTWGCEEENNWEDDDDGSIGGGWTLMDPQDAENDQEVQDALNFGVPELVKRAIASGELPDGSYSIDAVASVEEQVVSGMNYRFDVSLSSTDGLGVRVSFEVYSQPWTGTQELTSYFIFGIGSIEDNNGGEETTWGCEEEDNWEDNEEGSIGGGWTLMDPQDAENDQEVQDALNFGVPELVKRAIASGELPDGSYSLDAVASVEEQVVSGMNYRFDVSLSSAEGLGIRVSFEVYSQPWTGTQELTSYFIFGMGPIGDNSS